MAAHRPRTLAARLRRQRRPHDSPRLESPLHHPLGSPHQRIPRRPRLLHPHQRPRPRARHHSRQTGGIRYFQESEFLEDVFTMNDFGFPLKKPVHGKYLNTEFVGHTFPPRQPTTTSVSANTPSATPASTTSSPPTRNMRAASAGAPSTTTPTPTSAPATASAITASPTSSANLSPPPASTNRSAIHRRGDRPRTRLPLGPRSDESVGF